jgi:aminobenzoyl-glutamate transport protein
MSTDSALPPPVSGDRGRLARVLDTIERVGNRLPDPAVLFLILLGIVALLSAWLSTFTFAELDPRTQQPIVVRNLLAGENLTAFLANLVPTFVNFPPLGMVLVAMLGIGVAEHTGFITAALRALLSVTRKSLLTPMVAGVGIFSHVAADAGYVLVVPLGGLIFYAAGRHPLAGIAAAFAGVAGGFSASFLPTSLDPLLSGIAQAAAALIDPAVQVSPLNNYYFTLSSSLLIIVVVWLLTDKVIEPRLNATTRVDANLDDLPKQEALTYEQRRGLRFAAFALLAGLATLVLTALPADSSWRSDKGLLTAPDAPLMRSIVALIFVLFVLPGVVYGAFAGTVRSHRDVIAGMTKSMSGMGYYVVLAFFAAQFIAAFGQTNLGALVAIKGSDALREAGLPLSATIVGIILLTTGVNLLVGSASAKWALIAPVFVPMLMQLGVSPDLTQAAYRVGDSSTNIITPLLPYFPLIVIFCQKYVKGAGIGTLVALMLPYSITLLVVWTTFLLVYSGLGLPLGVGASYTYPAVQ